MAAQETCQLCKSKGKTKRVCLYYWRIDVCKKCEDLVRKNGHIK